MGSIPLWSAFGKTYLAGGSDMLFRVALFVLLFTGTVCARYPDGTIVLSSKKGLVGRIAKRITGGDQYTHSAIILNGRLYESDWPRAKVGSIWSYKRGTTNDYYVPVTPYSPSEVQAMLAKARSLIGRPYDLKNYRKPGSRQTYGTWCSPFVGQVLNNSGRHSLSSHDYYEPQNLREATSGTHRFYGRVIN